MKFDISGLEEIAKEMQAPSVVILCPPRIVDDLKERWDKSVANAEFKAIPYIDEDKIYIIPKDKIEGVRNV